jgi:hypothetical protein
MFLKPFLFTIFFSVTLISAYCMDTLFIVFDRNFNNQKKIEIIQYSKSNNNGDKLPCYQSNIYQFINDRKFIEERIIDTISFGNFSILNNTVFNEIVKPEILKENKILKQEYDEIIENNLDQSNEFLYNNHIMDLLISPVTHIEFERSSLHSKALKNIFFLSEIITDEDYLNFEDQLKEKLVYLIDLNENNSDILLARKVFYNKMSPYLVEK